MYKEWTFADVKKHIKAIKEIGFDEIYLSEGEFPYEIATDCESGGSHRMNIDTSIWFKGEEQGVPIRWSFDLEPRSANGSSKYHIDVKGCQEVLAKLKPEVAVKFRSYLKKCSESVTQSGNEYLEQSKEQFGLAALLKSI